MSTPDILNSRAQTLAKQLGVPIVASMHTRFESYPSYYGLGWLTPLVKAQLDRFYRRSDHVVAPTPTIVEEIKRLRGDDHASLWSRGVDRALFRPSRRDMDWRRAQGIGDGEIAILFFGRLVREKGIAQYVDVVGALQRAGLPIRPLLVGAGPGRDAFAPLASIVATGHLQDEALARAVASADIMLTPSITETFGNVVLEAMAAGLPVVSADAPSARGLIEHERTGFLCRAEATQEYLRICERLIASPELRMAVGNAALAASSLHSWDAASASVERVYREVRFSRPPYQAAARSRR